MDIMFTEEFNKEMKAVRPLSWSPVSSKCLCQPSHTSTAILFNSEPASEISCPNCEEFYTNYTCPKCEAVIWYSGHQINGDDYEDGI